MRLEEIRIKIGKPPNGQYVVDDYLGLDMTAGGGAGSIEELRRVKRKNFDLIKDLFPVEFNDLQFNHFKLCTWKGAVWWGEEEYDECIKEFSGETTEDIILYLYENRYSLWLQDNIEGNYDCISRIITKESRYNVLKRQRWRCNLCGETLKFSKNSMWDGEVAHIDHIHPFSKRHSYIHGENKINELSNLQALCPQCNLNKSNKEIN